MDAPSGGGAAIPGFEEVAGHAPWPWQRRLYRRFAAGDIPETLDIPTGLGKTSCVPLYLLARLRNPALARRIVYVVDRRAIVDATAEAARAWIDRIAANPPLARAFDAMSAFPSERPVRLGVLRGGLADDGEWRVDPARPAIVVGTVDTVGSRLLFSGYGDGRSRRAMHSGLLGHDAIVMLDEAHLSPAFAALARSIERSRDRRSFRAMTLSATVREDGDEEGAAFALLPEDEADTAVRARLRAAKAPRFHPVEKPAERVARMCDLAARHRSGSVAVFVRTVEDAGKVAARLAKALGEDGGGRVALLTGTLRGAEREALAAGAVWRRFRPDRDRGSVAPSVFLATTSAGEVGIDLDADHAVMDLATLDSTIQRLGRTNRAGLGAAEVDIVFEKKEAAGPAATSKTHRARLDRARASTLAVLRDLPGLSPAELRALDGQVREACFAPAARPARLGAETVEAFAATSARLPLPPVSIFLRGLSDEPDAPDAWLLWRREAAELARLGSAAAEEAIGFFRPRAVEVARVPARFARTLVAAALERQEGRALPLVVVGPPGAAEAVRLQHGNDIPPLDNATVVLPPWAGGLAPSGLPSVRETGAVADLGDDEDRLRYIEADGVRLGLDGAPLEAPDWLDSGSAIELRLPLPGAGMEEDDEDGTERVLVYARRRPDPALQTGDGDLTRLAAAERTVEAHCAEVADAARRIAEALRLPAGEAAALEAAGRWHDRGKDRRVWRLAAGVPAGGPALAKSRGGRLRAGPLGGYRHEFGSLVEAARALPADFPERDLALHLVAAHHGWARPSFPDRRQWDPDAPSAENRRLAGEASERFARLQARHGPWRLAWLEALLKAADAWASSGRGG